MVSLRHISLVASAFAVFLTAASGCDGGARTPDAQTQTAAYSAELAVRFEVGAAGAAAPATVSVLGFRAATAGGPDGADVLGLVDPLSAAAPAEGCVLRDVDVATSDLGTRGGSVDLEELVGVGVGLGPAEAPGDTVIHTFPRVFPDVAGVVGGVVGEAGPQPLTTLPEHISLYSPASELPLASLPVPALPRLLAVNGAAPAAGARIDASEGLTLTLGTAAGALIELRPFGATVAVSCAVPANASTEAMVGVPRALLAHLSGHDASQAGGVAVSLEVVRRSRVRVPLVTPATRVSVEIRSALPVELRP
jgi:hypothetical protein